MRAVVCNELGPPSLLRLEERPDPEPGPGAVAVAVEAAGVNYVDALFVAGQYQIKPAVPFVPGTESAGTVLAVGAGVTTLAPGDRVLVSAGLGGFASRLVAAEGSVTRIPDVLDSARAATFTQSYSTSLYALRERAGARAGEAVLVLGRRRRGRAGRHRGGPGPGLPGAGRGLERGEAGGRPGGRGRGGRGPGGRAGQGRGAGLGRRHRGGRRGGPGGRRAGRAGAARPGRLAAATW